MATPEPVRPAEISALMARLEALHSGADVDGRERERFLADKEQLIARIVAQNEGRPVLRGQVQDGADDDGADDQRPVWSCHEPPCNGDDDGDSGWGAS